MDTIETLKKYEARGMHNQLPIVWHCADNHTVWDENDKSYIDFSSGIFVTNCGHRKVSEAIQHQANRLLFGYSFPTKIKAKLLEKLISITPAFCEKVCLFSSGTEATEAAVKIMLLNGKKKGRTQIYSILGAMHGKTMLAEQLKYNSNDAWHQGSALVEHINLPLEAEIKNILYSPKSVAGIIIESYQGWSAKFYDKKDIKKIVAFANKYDIPVCFDEIQGGFGRTGKLFAYEHYGVTPDLVCIGKGLGGGLPISAVMGRAKLIDLPSDMSSTNSGNTLCCAGALESLKIIEDLSLVKRSKELGLSLNTFLIWLKAKCEKCIVEVNSTGLLGAIIFDSPEFAEQVCLNAMDLGLILVYTGRESVKIGPPLLISETALNKGFALLERAINKTTLNKKSKKKIMKNEQ